MLAIFVDINSLFLICLRLAHWHWDVSESYSRPLISSIVWSRFFLFSHAVFILIRPSVHPSICRSARFVCFFICDCYEWYWEWVTTAIRLPCGSVAASNNNNTPVLLCGIFAHMFTNIFLRSTVCWLGILTDVALLDFQDWTFMRICIGSGRGKDWKGGSYRRPWRVTLGTSLCWRLVPILYVMDWGMYTPGPYLAQGKTFIIGDNRYRVANWFASSATTQSVSWLAAEPQPIRFHASRGHN